MNFGWDELVKDGPYAVILSDPPWHFQVRSAKGEGRSASQHYPLMTLADIMAMPIQDLAADNCAFFLWATNPMLQEAIRLMKHYGFEYKTIALTWAKTNKLSPGFFMGLGYYTRQNTENLLLGTRGRPRRLGKGVRQLLVAPRTRHSEKPEEAQDRIEALLAGPYCELFARRPRSGWACWGAECPYERITNDHV